jgi:hypothetical protein
MKCYMEFLKCIRRKTDTLKALITILPLQSSPFGSVHNDPNIYAMTGRCPGSPFAFFGQGEDGHFHWDKSCIVSESLLTCSIIPR